MIVFLYVGQSGVIECPHPDYAWRGKSIDALLAYANDHAPLYMRCGGIYTVSPPMSNKDWLF